jgi:hypothetical protein
MLGHKWEKAAATVVEVTGGSIIPPPGSGSRLAGHALREYLIEIRRPGGEVVRTMVTENSRFAHSAGSPIHVEVNFKTGEAKIDSHAMSKMAQETLQGRGRPSATGAVGMVNVADQIRMQAAEMAGSSPGRGGGDLAGAIGAAIASSSVHVTHIGGQRVQLNASQAAELRQLTRDIVSGDPAVKQAAKERFHQLRAELLQQPVTGPAGQGFDAAGSTFDPIGTARPAESFSAPAAGAQDFFGQVSPPSFGPPAAFGSFAEGTGQGTAEERLTKLQQLFDKGILTESEYQAKRQQIISSL